jgi:hypothetical protein
MLQGKSVGDERFVFRVRMGEYEVELRGSREEVLRVLENLPGLMGNVQRAFDSLKPKTVATLTVKTEAPKAEMPPAQKYPKITPVKGCDEALLRILETDWGKWRPRTLDELKEAIKANGLSFSGRILAGTLMGLVKKGTVRRWKTNAGFVYILAEEKSPT